MTHCFERENSKSVDSPFALGTASLLEVFGVKSTKVLTFLALRSPMGFGARAQPTSLSAGGAKGRMVTRAFLLSRWREPAFQKVTHCAQALNHPPWPRPPLFLSAAHRGSCWCFELSGMKSCPAAYIRARCRNTCMAWASGATREALGLSLPCGSCSILGCRGLDKGTKGRC